MAVMGNDSQSHYNKNNLSRVKSSGSMTKDPAK